MKNLDTIFFALAVTLGISRIAVAQSILYMSVDNKIQRLDLAQSDIEDLVEAPLNRPGSMAVDAETGHVYWSSLGRGMIMRANRDGTDIRQVQAGRLVGLDAETHKMYVLADSMLRRTNLDGTDEEELFTLTDRQSPNRRYPPVAIDLEGKLVYWIGSLWEIHRANLDGTEQTTIANAHGSGQGTLDGILVDPVGGWLYPLSGWGPGNATRMNLDGSGSEPLPFSHGWIGDLAVDSLHQKAYWVDFYTRETQNFIRRTNLDGSEAEDLIPLKGSPGGITLDAHNDALFWNTEFGIWRSRLDGSEVEQLVESNMDSPHGLRVDAAGGHVYWANWHGIGRHDLDGRNETILIDGLEHEVPDIAIDMQAEFLYWALIEDYASADNTGIRDYGAGRIQRSRLDGTDVEDVIVLPNASPRAVEVDGDSGRLFWSTTRGTFSARLDGSQVTQIDSRVESFIRIDAVHERIYGLVTDHGDDMIGWTNMDGTLSEVLYPVPGGATLALDPVNEHVYWTVFTDGEGDAIWRGSLSSVGDAELVASGLGRINSLTMDLAATSTRAGADVVPNRFELAQNYPNPFNPSTAIQYTLVSTERISVKVRDAQGRMVAVLVDDVRPVGTHDVIWAADKHQPSGVYFYTLETGSGTVTRSMLLLK